MRQRTEHVSPNVPHRAYKWTVRLLNYCTGLYQLMKFLQHRMGNRNVTNGKYFVKKLTSVFLRGLTKFCFTLHPVREIKLYVRCKVLAMF
jgi:hypothetical protein